MDSRSYNKFWVVTGILGLKGALNSSDFGIVLLEIVLGHKHACLWEHPELFGCWHAHRMGASKGLIA